MCGKNFRKAQGIRKEVVCIPKWQRTVDTLLVASCALGIARTYSIGLKKG